MIKRVLFICQGNVGRSQMAEGYYNHLTASQNGTSAGVVDVAAKYNYHPTELIIEIMREDGVEVRNQKVKQIQPEMLFGIDLVCVLCEREILPTFLLESDVAVVYRQVPDPYGVGKESSIAVRDQVKEVVKGLIDSQI